ncbi:hypothetical protein RF11_01658 [Thelohanellus kitauei]|uniref:Uncharacterized protein n=1 Tax=Thelohanellus kitauei TaxID=669202 RepID=A0A0C2NA24_THEKT|nr:hypothetical protein RF11_01658 [Thelohanellus kitauei]
MGKHLLVDMKDRTFVNANTYTSVYWRKFKLKRFQLGVMPMPKYMYGLILRDFLDLSTPKLEDTSPKHMVRHSIVTHGPPVYIGDRRYARDKFDLTKAEF